MRNLVATMVMLIVLSAVAFAQEITPSDPAASEPVMVPAAVGTVLRGYIQDPTGQAVVGQLKVTGTSPDDLFTYWVATDGQNYYGFDVYREVWRPGPVQYLSANLLFQGDIVEGWLRSFNGMVDRDFFFGKDGVVYQRFYNEYNGKVVYTYFVHTATGQRSDNLDLLNTVTDNTQLTQTILAQQADQQQKFLAEFAKRGEDYAFWRKKGEKLPEQLPSLVTWGTPSETLNRDLPADQPSLLDLIEKEVGPIKGDKGESGDQAAGSEDSGATEPSAPSEPSDTGSGDSSDSGDSGSE